MWGHYIFKDLLSVYVYMFCFLYDFYEDRNRNSSNNISLFVRLAQYNGSMCGHETA